MAEMTQADDGRERTSVSEYDEGDRIFMGINLHGSTDDVPGTEYDRDIRQAGVEGTLTEGLSDADAEILEDDERGRPMTNVTVETDDGRKFTWNVDNGYVIGPCDNPDRSDRSDVGKIGGFYSADS